MKLPITITVNGETWPLDVEPNEVLLDVIRERVGAKGAKIGCERGDCGTCTILFDGHTIRSCLMLAIEADGHDVTTVEGIPENGVLSPLQDLFISHNSFQCGFCAPGIVLGAHELLRDNPNPSRYDVQHALAGNLCRCTGYEPIIDAVLEAAGEVQP